MSQKKKQNKKKGNQKTKSASKGYPFLFLLVPLALSLIAFFNTFQNGFVNWDDPVNFLQNPWIANPEGLNIIERIVGIFSSDVIGNYNPLSTASYLIDKSLFGFDHPAGWHVVNVLLHTLVVYLVFRVGRMLNLSHWGAMTLAILFAIHPMRVESVAWITERKDVLFASFYFLSILQYLKYQKSHSKSNQTWMYVFFVLALFSKVQAVSLPLSLLCIDYLQGRGINKQTIISKAPLWILSLIFGIVGIIVLRNHGSIVTGEESPMWHGLFYASTGLFTYLYKVIAPIPLSSYYAPPESLSTFNYLTAAVFPILGFVMYKSYKSNKAVFFGLLFFLVNVVFVLQLVKAGQGYLADRFTYVAYFGLFFIIANYIDKGLTQKKTVYLSFGLIGFIVGAFMTKTIKQNQYWENGETLWTNVIKHNPESMRPYGARGNYYYRAGKYQQSIHDYNKALSIKDNEDLRANRGKAIYFKGSNPDSLSVAIDDFTRAIQFNPEKADHYLSRGAVYVQLKLYENAVNDFTLAITKRNDFAEAYMNRGRIFHATQKYELALNDFNEAVKISPNDPEFLFELGRTQRALGKNNEAINSITKALNNGFKQCVAQLERGYAYFALGDNIKAKTDINQAKAAGCPVDPQVMTLLNR